MAEKANSELRERIEREGIKYWAIASVLHIDESTICKWFRRELSPERRAKVEAAINALTAKAKE